MAVPVLPILLLLLTMSTDSDAHTQPPAISAADRRILAGTESTSVIPTLTLSPSPSPSTARTPHRKHKNRVRNNIISFFAGCVVGSLSTLSFSIMLGFLLLCIRGRHCNRLGAEIFSPIINSKHDLAFLEKNDGLADLAVIGSGGCGEVYRKDLGAKTIAIKKIRKVVADRGGGGEPLSDDEARLLDKWTRQIRSEVRTVGRIRHRNLLPLIAHVATSNCHYLVYEYMKNGSLHDVLRDAAEGRRELDWGARYRIAVGIAAGLEHLHVHCKPRVIHRDLKPGNVLLDEGMEARIADFGFAREVPDANTHMTASNVAGTVGYIAPEYYQTLKYTTKCDVYSFGVILGVMVMGRFPADDFFEETDEMSLVRWMRNRVREGNAAACFDGQLVGKGDEKKMELVLRLACFCTADDPRERPSSKELRLMLSQICGR